MACFVAVESDGVDEALDFGFFKALKIGWGEMLAGSGGEEALDGGGGAGVLCSGGEYCADEDAEWIVRLRLDKLDYWRGMRVELAL